MIDWLWINQCTIQGKTICTWWYMTAWNKLRALWDHNVESSPFQMCTIKELLFHKLLVQHINLTTPGVTRRWRSILHSGTFYLQQHIKMITAFACIVLMPGHIWPPRQWWNLITDVRDIKCLTVKKRKFNKASFLQGLNKMTFLIIWIRRRICVGN